VPPASSTLFHFVRDHYGFHVVRANRLVVSAALPTASRDGRPSALPRARDRAQRELWPRESSSMAAIELGRLVKIGDAVPRIASNSRFSSGRRKAAPPAANLGVG